MSKYILFGWSAGLNSDTDPADKVLGTTSELPEESEAAGPDDDNTQYFGLRAEEREVPLVDTIFKGKAQQMIAYVSYSHHNPEGGRPIFAAYLIPGTETVDG